MTIACDTSAATSAASVGLYVVTTGFGAVLTIVGGRVLERYKHRDRRRELAGALLGECERIRKSLGVPNDKIGVMEMDGLEFETPNIHRWIEPLVAEAAVIDVRLVELFVKVDTELHSYRVLVGNWQDTEPSNPFIEEEAVVTRKDAVIALREIESLLTKAR